MRNASLAVLGVVGLLLLCGQGTAPGDVRVGTGGSGTAGTGTQPAATGGDASSAELRQTVLQLQSEVAQLRQDLSRVRSELASIAASSRSAAASTGDTASGAGVGGSGQAGETPSVVGSGAPAVQDPSGGTAAANTVSGAPLRAGTAQETGTQGTQAQDTANSGDAVVDAFYTGTVRSVSARQLVLVDEAGQSFTVELGKQTRVLHNGQRIAAQDLKKGTRVRATVDMLSGHTQATEVTTLSTK